MTDWRDRAACRGMGPALFFPDEKQRFTTARMVCDRCPVRAECAEFGENEPDGLWGGLSARDRDNARRRLALAARA